MSQEDEIAALRRELQVSLDSERLALRNNERLRARLAVLEACLRRIASPSPDVGAFGDWQRGYCERGDMARAALSPGEGA